MKHLVVLSVIALGTSFAPRLAAMPANQLTKVTFSGPVEIPGQVLPAGTYQFKILDFNDAGHCPNHEPGRNQSRCEPCSRFRITV